MTFIVYKLDPYGNETLKYDAQVLERSPKHICIRAPFTLETRDLGYMVLKKGDIFTEWFYTERWYNIFRIDDVDTGNLKGFYCNFTRPAIITAHSVKSEDLELDLFVYPDGSMTLLDEDEYSALALSKAEMQHVDDALNTLKKMVEAQSAPFDSLTSHHQGE